MDAAPAAPAIAAESNQEFSPVMRPLVRPTDGADGAAVVSPAVAAANGQIAPIRTICCVGAGYVGTSYLLEF